MLDIKTSFVKTFCQVFIYACIYLLGRTSGWWPGYNIFVKRKLKNNCAFNCLSAGWIGSP
jgi:hypothetical protein